MVLPLNVSGPFHSPLLETAKKKLEISLKDVQINNFIIPYVSNVNAKYINYSCDIKSLLSEQIVYFCEMATEYKRNDKTRGKFVY